MGAQASGRLVQLDMLRFLAICLVVLIHFEGYLLAPWPALERLAFSAGEIGVPLFVMLTGYLMVPRVYENGYVRRFASRNLIPLFVAFGAWSLLWWLLATAFPQYSRKAGASPFDSVLRSLLLLTPSGNGLWFLPMMLGIYLGLPILSLAVRYFSGPDNLLYRRIVLGALVLFGTVAPTVEQVASALGHPLGIRPALEMNIFGAGVWGGSVWTLYLVLGAWLAKVGVSSFPRPWLAGLAVAGFGFQWSVKLLGIHFGTGGGINYANTGLVVCSGAIFALFLTMAPHGAVLAQAASQGAFGVYVLHVWIGEALWVSVQGVCDVSSLPLAGAMAVLGALVACTTVLSYVAVHILDRLPGVGPWLLLMK